MTASDRVPTILQRITAARRKRIECNRRKESLEMLRQKSASMPPTRDFAASLAKSGTGRVGLIAEYKRRSPSRGAIRLDLGCPEVVAAYERGGAAAVSILTEPDFFGGDDAFVGMAREAVNVPILRKDFVVDEYQVYESRVLGADALLLIVALLDDRTLRMFLEITWGLGMEAVVEVHTVEQLKRAVNAGAHVIGVNNRDLRSFETLLSVSERLVPMVPDGVLTVSESGIKSLADLRRVSQAGAGNVLVGETLMRSRHIEEAVRELVGEVAVSDHATTAFAKVCGIRTRDAAEAAVSGGADAVGFVFANSSRHVTVDEAAGLSSLVRRLSPQVLRVGVFVNADIDDVRQVVDRVGLDVVQLHGDEPAAYCLAVRRDRELQVWKALRMGDGARPVEGRIREYDDAGVDGYVLDTHVPGRTGGTGKTYDWALVGPLRSQTNRLLLVAGGLNADNVAEALVCSGADGVDVSTGVEVQGEKDSALISAFLARVHERNNDSNGGTTCHQTTV